MKLMQMPLEAGVPHGDVTSAKKFSCIARRTTTASAGTQTPCYRKPTLQDVQALVVSACIWLHIWRPGLKCDTWTRLTVAWSMPPGLLGVALCRLLLSTCSDFLHRVGCFEPCGGPAGKSLLSLTSKGKGVVRPRRNTDPLRRRSLCTPLR